MSRQAPQKAPEQKQQQAEKKEKDPIVSGADAMQSELEDLRTALKAGNADGVSQQARQLDDAWEGFERKLAAKNYQLHEQVKASLHSVLAAAQLVPTDTRGITAEIDKLDQKLNEVKHTKGKAPKPEQVELKTGAAAMRHGLVELGAAVDTGDTAKMQEKAGAVERSWTQFEDEVHDRSKKTYRSIEDSLHALMAQVKVWPVDKAKLKQQISKLDAQLADLMK